MKQNRMSLITRIYLAIVFMKNSIVLGVLKPLMSARAVADARKAKEAERSKTDKENVIEEEIITLADVAGYDAAKESLEFFVNCLKNHAVRSAAGADIPSCLLLYGPPGTGKAMMAAAVAGSADVPLYAISAASLVSKYVGYGSASVHFLFMQASANSPCVVFIDDLDAISEEKFDDEGEYRSTINALLSELDGMDGSGVLTVAATSRIGDLNPDLMRPGRFVHKIEIPLPE